MRRLLFTTVVQNIGCLAAYPFSPYVSDGFGRRTAVGLGAIIMCAATVLQTASHSVSMFIGARYVVSWKDTLFSCIPFQGRRRSCLNENEKKKSLQLHDRIRADLRRRGCTGPDYRDRLSYTEGACYLAVQHPLVRWFLFFFLLCACSHVAHDRFLGSIM